MRKGYPRLSLFASWASKNEPIQTDTKLCKNCKYIITNKRFQPSDPRKLEWAKCEEYPKVVEDDSHFVTGVLKPTVVEYYSCAFARKWQDMCGPEGFKYVAKDEDKDQF